MLSMITGFWSKKAVTLTPKQEVASIEKQIKALEAKIDLKKPFEGKARRLSKIIGGTAIGASAGTATGMFFFSTTLIPVLGVSAIGAFGAMALVRYFNGGLSLIDENRITFEKINTHTKELVEAKIDVIDKAKNGDICDFVFNYKHSSELKTKDSKERKKERGTNDLVQENKKTLKDDEAIIPVKMDRKKLSSLMAVLQRKVSRGANFTLRKIDISDASLTDRKLDELLAAGLGAFNTESLILGSNALTDEGVEFLKKCIVDENDSFQNLKKLSLQGNKLTHACLPHLLAIVQHLNLQKLVLSNNPSLASHLNEREKPIPGTEAPMAEFLRQTPSKMSSLRKLKLSNTGLQAAHAQAIGNVLRKSALLQSLDIQRNKGVTYRSIADSVKGQGLEKAVSLEEMHSDHDTVLNAARILRKRDAAFKGCTDDKLDETPWALHLINYKMEHKKLPSTAAKYLSKTAFSVNTIQQIIETIQDARTQHLGIKEGMSIAITQRELIAYYSKNLHALYRKVRAGDANDDVESELIDNIREVKKPKQQRRVSSRKEKNEIKTSEKTKRSAPRKPESRSPKAKILALPALKKVDTQDTKVPVVVTPSQPKVLPQFNAAKNASLRAEIEKNLSAYSLSRNPQLNKKTPPNQKTTRFRV
ncbi:hypothetical protein [Candidatus Berkiella aquae]|uniref:Leucine Rich repeats (2 copies) n=1 Tax=Candidatus Berkiella aquae TaxID=295108 RepID=A0A0Q9YPB9_9GAMM|nr:hypothetical protein [Candidatus Berkiella aquae]MCS5710538.1 hypothetical protein [Candidatus Berkiella aquae]